MRAREFMVETTTSGSIATVAMPMAQVQRRVSAPLLGKYTKKNSRKKPHASR